MPGQYWSYQRIRLWRTASDWWRGRGRAALGEVPVAMVGAIIAAAIEYRTGADSELIRPALVGIMAGVGTYLAIASVMLLWHWFVVPSRIHADQAQRIRQLGGEALLPEDIRTFNDARVALYRQVFRIIEAFTHFGNLSRRFGKLPTEVSEPELAPLRERFAEELRELHRIISDRRTPFALARRYDEPRIQVQRALELHPVTRGRELLVPLRQLYDIAREDHVWDQARPSLKLPETLP